MQIPETSLAALRASAGAESAGRWRHAICSTFVELDCRPASNDAFFGAVSTRHCGPLQFSIVSSTGQTVMRQVSRKEPDEQDFFLLALQMIGTGCAAQDGRLAHQLPGDMTLYDTAGRYELSFDGDFRQFVVKIPRLALSARLSAPETRTGLLFPASDPSVRIASRFLNELAAEAGALPEAEAARSSEIALDLIAMVLDARPRPQREEPAAARQGALIQRVRYFVRDNLANPMLNPQRVAAAHGVSARYLNMVLEKQGLSLGRMIQQLRLEACAAQLADPHHAAMSITAIAYAAGFSDSAHFSRSFRSYFGLCPREFRQRARERVA